MLESLIDFGRPVELALLAFFAALLQEAHLECDQVGKCLSFFLVLRVFGDLVTDHGRPVPGGPLPVVAVAQAFDEAVVSELKDALFVVGFGLLFGEGLAGYFGLFEVEVVVELHGVLFQGLHHFQLGLVLLEGLFLLVVEIEESVSGERDVVILVVLKGLAHALIF